jgi:hypothetical protein
VSSRLRRQCEPGPRPVLPHADACPARSGRAPPVRDRPRDRRTRAGRRARSPPRRGHNSRRKKTKPGPVQVITRIPPPPKRSAGPTRPHPALEDHQRVGSGPAGGTLRGTTPGTMSASVARGTTQRRRSHSAWPRQRTTGQSVADHLPRSATVHRAPPSTNVMLRTSSPSCPIGRPRSSDTLLRTRYARVWLRSRRSRAGLPRRGRLRAVGRPRSRSRWSPAR